ncbi:MAG: VWA domain-containing protein [Bryobacteraceae bacterium]|nr:VWA domain-containing protein [Bryobacteraceae bacterium]MDW8378930.1 VWA domain-containing protein [Bryobacterales bacterium]
MTARRFFLSAGLLLILWPSAKGNESAPGVVFRSDVSLVRVDVQVLEGKRAVSGLRREDFILREEGIERDIRNFLAEDMPVDFVLLLDVSASMRPHVQRIANGASQALQVLGREDRVAIMVFDRQTRLRMPFQSSLESVEDELANLLNQERFNGGTDINRGIYDAARYIQGSARKDARRAIVILTDDQTEFERDEFAVANALARADTTLSLLLAPDAMRGRWGGGAPSGGGGDRTSWPVGLNWPDIIFGRRGPSWPGSGGPVIRGSGTRSAGTAEIARLSGGDSMSIDEAGALERTFSRLRQRYALHFLLPEGARAGQQRQVEVLLAAAARRRYPDAELKYRRTYLAVDSASPAPSGEPTTVSSLPTVSEEPSPSSPSESERPRLRRRPINEPQGSSGPLLSENNQEGTSTAPKGPVWRRVDGPPENDPSRVATTPSPAEPGPNSATDPPATGRWRKLKPGEKP